MASKSSYGCGFGLPEIVKKISFNSDNLKKLRIDIQPNDNLQNSAVLVPIVIHDGQTALLFTLRSKSLERHSGQVSFPGGLIEKDDQSAIETALRETEEEIGIKRKNINIIGRMSSFTTSTGYIIYPVIGVINSLDMLTKNSIEVDRIFCIPLIWLCDPAHSKIKDFLGADGKNRKVWFFDPYDGELLWGITAKITKDLVEILKK